IERARARSAGYSAIVVATKPPAIQRSRIVNSGSVDTFVVSTGCATTAEASAAAVVQAQTAARATVRCITLAYIARYGPVHVTPRSGAYRLLPRRAFRRTS